MQEPHGITSQETAFFIVTTMKTSNLTKCMVDLQGIITAHLARLTINGLDFK
jgi:hypothetical protein